MGDEEKEKRLLWCVKNNEVEEVKKYVNEGADVNAMISGRRPLHHAADSGHSAVIDFLVSKGADVNAEDNYGITPLLSAIYENQTDCVKLLLKLGAKNGKNQDGISYKDCAESEEIKALLK